jgi:hypothetical protein
MAKVDRIAQQSTQNGKALAAALSTTGLTLSQLESKLRALANQEQQNVNAASSLDPPGRVRPENVDLVEALQLRVNGLAGLATILQRTASSTNTTKDAATLAAEAERLTASDVVWDDFFYSPVSAQLKDDGVSGVPVPLSYYTPVANPDLFTQKQMYLTLQRLRGASTGGTPSGPHGDALLSVVAQPGNQTLTASGLNTVKSGTSLAFDVTVEDSGNFEEGQIPVTLTIDQATGQGGAPITKTETIQLIDPGQQKVVTFDLGNANIPFSSTTTLSVDVAAVPGEVNKANNSAQYQVQFVLP